MSEKLTTEAFDRLCIGEATRMDEFAAASEIFYLRGQLTRHMLINSRLLHEIDDLEETIYKNGISKLR